MIIILLSRFQTCSQALTIKFMYWCLNVHNLVRRLYSITFCLRVQAFVHKLRMVVEY